MGSFEITAPDGRKFKVTGDTPEGAMRALQKSLGETEPAQAQPGSDALSQTRTGLGGFIEGIPIAGPFIRRGAEMAAAGTAAALDPDRDFQDFMDQIDRMNAEEKTANPGIDIASQFGGAIATTGLAGATKRGAQMLGMGGGSLPSRALRLGTSGAAISGADQAARDIVAEGAVDPVNVAGAAGIGGAVSSAIPVVGAGARKVVGGAVEKVGDAVRATLDPARQAGRRISQAIDIDRASDLNALGADDVATAVRNNQPIINADLGGETTRALARAAANQSPEARGALERTIGDRFATQAARLSDKVRNLAGNVDDLSSIDTIKRAAAASNRPAYIQAESAPEAQAIFTPKIQQLLQSPRFRQATKAVPKRLADRAAVEGGPVPKNPFMTAEDGSFILQGDAQAPGLRYWDQVKRNLDGQIATAKRSNNNSLTTDLTSLKNTLVDELDAIVPAYKTARQGAASFFQAEDAVEAGKKFFKSTRMLPEFKRGIQKMTEAERKAFETGFASEILDAAAASRDRQNVISRYFTSPESRAKIELAFGKPKAREFEAFVRVENAMDMLRGAVGGNSTTARQLLESGLLGGAGWAYSGDPTVGISTAMVGAGARLAGRAAGKKINENVMKQVADMLLSNDPKVVERAIKMSARSPQHLAAVDAITQVIGAASRGAAITGANQLNPLANPQQ
jgi:hypothetical protein